MTRDEIIAAILDVGLFVDCRGNLYGEQYETAIRNDGGVWQHPDELADFLLFLSEKNIKSFLNIGTFNGRTFNLIADFLNSIQPVRCVTVDPIDHRPAKSDAYEYSDATSDAFVGQRFDLVFIDGHHGYEESRRDYDNVGRHARYVAFHDIDDDFIRGDQSLNGGVSRLWEELKPGAEFVEFVAAGKPSRVMGIGVIINDLGAQ
jgi:hypothetical protein